MSISAIRSTRRSSRARIPNDRSIPRPIRPRRPQLGPEKPLFASLSASAFGALLLFSDGRGIELKVGHEEVGYHFWSTGDMRVMAVLDQFKIGIMAPFTYGREEAGFHLPLTYEAGALPVPAESLWSSSNRLRKVR